MRGVIVAGLATAVRAQVGTTSTWTTQSPLLPDYEWIVLDHADGNSMGYGVTVAGNYVYVAGSMSTVVRIENPETGAFVESEDQGSDGDVYLAKVSLDGEPTEVWPFSGSANEFPAHLSTAPDEMSVAMTGYFSGNITFGAYAFDNADVTNDTTPAPSTTRSGHTYRPSNARSVSSSSSSDDAIAFF